MKKPTKKQVFLILFLTIFVSAGAFAYKVSSCSIDERVDFISNKIVKKLDLQEHQSQKLEILKQQIVSKINQVKQEKQQRKEKLLAIISDEQFDREAATIFLQEKTQLINNEASPLIIAFADFYDSLEAEQQQLIRDKVASFKGRSHHRY